MCSSDYHPNMISSSLSGGLRQALPRQGSSRLAIETKSVHPYDLGDVDTWHHSGYLMRGWNGVGRWGDLRLSTANAGGTGAKLIV